MRPRINNLSPRALAIQLLFTVGVLGVFAVPAVGNPGARVVVREEVKAAHRAVLLEKLRLIRGLNHIRFDSRGALVLGSAESNGSTSARELLTRAVEGNKFIVIEDATNRADIAFCRVVPGKSVGNTTSSLPVYVVLIDFEDFKYVTGDARARAAFDVGWGLLHELDHVVGESDDPTNASVVGECEEHLNQMRRELGLPIRSSYFFNALRARTDPNFITRLVRLGFIETDASQNKTKRYWLIWDATLVGGIDGRSETALVKPASQH